MGRKVTVKFDLLVRSVGVVVASEVEVGTEDAEVPSAGVRATQM